jgi:hypothetical protein
MRLGGGAHRAAVVQGTAAGKRLIPAGSARLGGRGGLGKHGGMSVNLRGGLVMDMERRGGLLSVSSIGYGNFPTGEERKRGAALGLL